MLLTNAVRFNPVAVCGPDASATDHCSYSLRLCPAAEPVHVLVVRVPPFAKPLLDAVCDACAAGGTVTVQAIVPAPFVSDRDALSALASLSYHGLFDVVV